MWYRDGEPMESLARGPGDGCQRCPHTPAIAKKWCARSSTTTRVFLEKQFARSEIGTTADAPMR